MKHHSLSLARTGAVAALYTVLTVLSASMGLSSGVVQVRLSEALCILPAFLPEAVPGLFLGCILSNLLTGALIWDVIFGGIATLLGALGTRVLAVRAAAKAAADFDHAGAAVKASAADPGHSGAAAKTSAADPGHRPRHGYAGRILLSIPPILSNAFIVPLILRYAYHIDAAYPYMVLTVFLGETIACLGLGQLLYSSLKQYLAGLLPDRQ